MNAVNPEIGRAAFEAVDGGASTVCAPVAGRPMIDLLPGAYEQAVDFTIKALLEASPRPPIFERGGILMRPVKVEGVERVDGITRLAGALTLRQVTATWAQQQISRVIGFRKFDARSQTFKITDAPERVALTVVDAPDLGAWPPLLGVLRCPVMLPSGRLISAAGYDRETAMFADWTIEWDLPTNPDRDQAADALHRLHHLLRHFPFVGPVDRAVAVSYLLSCVQRPVLTTAPAHAIDSTEPGSGKGLIVTVGATIATGGHAAVLDWGADPAESAKRIDGVVLAGDAIVNIDNCERPVEGPAICQFITEQSKRIRPLGGSQMVSAPCIALVAITGVNLTLRGDIVRRAIVCRLDAGVERPELRAIDQDILAEVHTRRVELVRDILTITTAYARAGFPDVGLSPLGGFAEWSKVVRAALVWCGSADPCESMARLRADDPQRSALRTVFRAWHEAVGDTSMTAAEMIARAHDDEQLRQALELVAARRGHFDARALGWWLRANRDRRMEGLQLAADGHTRDSVQRWAVRTAVQRG